MKQTTSQTPDYIARIQLRYPSMCGAEQKLADFFLTRDRSLPVEDSVKRLAQKADVSVASVVRFCQELGYSGYAEFKLMTQQVGFLPSVGNFVLSEETSAAQLKKNISEFTSHGIQKCAQMLDDAQIEAAIGKICAANSLLICGIGTSAGIAISAANTFMSLGIPCIPLSEELLMLRTSSMLGSDDVVLAITNCGSVKPIVDVIMLAQQMGATTILITGEDTSLARKYADHVLCTNTYGNPSTLDMLTVTSCQLITIQILQAGCFAHSGQKVLDNVRQNAALSEMTRYGLNVDEVKRTRVKF